MSVKQRQRIRTQVHAGRIVQCHHPYGILVQIVTAILVASIPVVSTGHVRWLPQVIAAPAPQNTTVVRAPAVAGSKGARLYVLPGGDVRRNLPPGTVITAVGRSEDNLWIVVQMPNLESGWVQIDEIVLYDVDKLPILLEDNEVESAPQAEAQSASAGIEATATPIASLPPTPEQQATETLISSSPQSGQLSLVAVVLVANAGLYDQPGGTLLEQLAAGIVVAASARTQDSEWLWVAVPSGTTGWIQIADVVITNVNALPVQEPATTGSVPPASAPIPDSSTPPASSSEESVPPSDQKGATPSPSNPVIATVIQIDSRLNIRSGPSTDYLILGKAASDDRFEVNGRNAPATWIQIKTEVGENGLAWVSSDYVTLSHPILGLPIADPSQDVVLVTSPPIGDIRCTTNQIIKWDNGQGQWICSDDLSLIQTEVANLRAELEALRAELTGSSE